MNVRRWKTQRKIEIESLESRKLLSIALGADLHKAGFVDSTGDTINVSLQGPGNADITLSNGDNGDISGITFTGTTSRSVFTLTPKTGSTVLGEVTIHGAMRSISAGKVDLAGNIVVEGTLDSIKLHDIVGAHTIDIQGTTRATSATFNLADDLLLQSAGAFKTITATRWLASNAGSAGVRATRLAKLSILGNKKAGIAGDLSANAVLSATGAGVLGAFVVKGAISSCTWNIAGDAGSIIVGGNSAGWNLNVGGNVSSLAMNGALTGNNAINIAGSAKSIKLKSPVTVAAPASGPTTQVHVGGRATVSSTGQKLKFSNADVFSNSSISYPFADLQAYATEGKQWTYQTTYKGGSNSGTSETTLRVSHLTTDSGQTQATVQTTVDDVNVSLKWIDNDSGTYLSGWSVGDAEGTFDLHIDPLKVSSDAIGLGQITQATTNMSGSFSISNGIDLTGTMAGTAHATTKFLRHEQITTPAGTYLAAKVSIALTLSGTIDIDVGDKILHVKFSATQNQTAWFVPGLGAVRSTTAWKIAASLPGGGSSALRFTSDQLLTSSS